MADPAAVQAGVDDVPAPGYPDHWEADVVLRDGGTAHLRPIRPDDAEALQDFHLAQSPESVYLRFFAPMPRLSDRDLTRFTRVDHVDRVAIVALVGGRIVGVGRFDRTAPRVAEVAFNISDHHQGRGLGSVLLEHLAAAALERGIQRFEAEVLPQNRKMVGVFRDAGYEVSNHYDDGVISLAFDIDPTERSMAVMAAREHRAEAASLAALLHPRSVAVIGASSTEGTIGEALMSNLLEGGFTGAIHPVHPTAEAVAGLPAHPDVTSIGQPVDLAVVAVRAAAVQGVLGQCARAGVRGVVVVSGGFAESGEEGARLQAELVREARAQGMRVVGPNSFGMLNTDEAVRLNASLSPVLPAPGRLGLFSQSGALGVAVLSAAARRGLGLSSLVSAGNRADVSGNDLLQFWEDDPRTDVVCLYLESVGNPRKFSRVARRISRAKPVVVVKSGTSGYGVPAGHVVRESRAPREAFDAMLRQAGVVRTENIHQMFDVAQLLVNQPLPAGRRIGVVTNSDALASLVADALTSWDLELAGDPITVATEADAATFGSALRQAFSDPSADAVVTSFIPPIATVDAELVEQVAAVSAGSGKTALACFVGLREVTHEGMRGTQTVPAYPTPEDAVRALAAVTRYAEWRRRDQGAVVDPPGCDRLAARIVVEEALAATADDAEQDDQVLLDPAQTRRLLAAYGISTWPTEHAATAEDAVAAAHRVGWPVAVKYADKRLRERRDVMGARLDVPDEPALRQDLAAMVAGTDDPAVAAGFLVQPMAPSGVPVVVTTMEDPLFGPIVSFGLAGDAVDLLGDVAHRIPPLTDVDVHDLVRSVKASPRLFGYRGTPALDVAALEDLLARVSVLSDELPEVVDLRLDPVVVGQQGLAPLWAQVRLARPPDRRDTGTRRAL
jgi:acyl-CoA synthetase (NDP forming)/RimJ/RimL family protein N-acetyltransferase